MTTPLTIINPESLGPPRGYANGVIVPPGARLLFIAGQIAWDEQQRIAGPDFAEQFERALMNVITVVRAAGGRPENIARLLVFVTDKREYLSSLSEVGRRWRALMGSHYPAMALVEVKSLLEDAAKIEIEGIAVLQ